MSNALQELRYALRTLRKNPAFTATALATLTLGIGANTAIFSVVNGVLLRPLPYPEPDEVVQVRSVFGNGSSGQNVSFPNYEDLREESRTFDAMAAYAADVSSVSGTGGAVRLTTAWVSAGFFEVLGVTPALGRTFLPEELGTGASAAVVSHAYWQSRLGADQDLSNQVVRMGDRVFDVVGVMPPGFAFPTDAELWLASQETSATQSRSAGNFQVIGRLRAGVTPEQGNADLSAVARDLKLRYGDDTPMYDAAVVPLREELVGHTRPALLILLGAAGFLLLIACANVVNLLLARMASRQRELSVRLALGASARRLVGHVLAEALVLSLAGGLLGILLASRGVPALLALEPGGLPRLDQVGADWLVLLFALGISLATALALALVPALRATGADVRGALASTQRTTTGGASAHSIRRILVVSQVAATLMLLVGASLLARSFFRVLDVDPGYRTRDALVMDLWVPWDEGEAAITRLGLFHEELRSRLRGVAGVEEVGGVNTFPLSGGGSNGTFVVLNSLDEIPGLAALRRREDSAELMTQPAALEQYDRLSRDSTRTGSAEYRIAGEGYFRAMGIPLLRGRLFDDRDRPDAPHVAVISESLAESRWPGQDPLGRLIEFGNMDGDLRPFTVVGVVGDVREQSTAALPRPTIYASASQRPGKTYNYHIALRGAADQATMVAAARRIVAELNPNVPVRFRTLEQIFSESLAERRFTLLLLGAFGATALLLAVLGIYGVISYLASQRTREIGIRIAIGARPADVRRLLMGQGAGLAAIGIAIGLVLAVGLTRFLAGLLYEVNALDPVTLVGVSLALGLVALLASYLPARRASRVDPMVTLRSE